MRSARRAAVVAAVAALAAAAPSRAQQPLTLDAAVARALESNRELAVARLARRSAEAAIDVAREWPNPEVTYEAEKETPRQSIGASLPIELGGKRARRTDLATAGVAVVDKDVARLSADVRTRVRRAYFALAAARARLQLAEDLRGLAVRARDAAQARFDAGDVPRLELLQTELALVETDNGVSGARGEASAAAAELNGLLASPPDAPLALADPLTGGRVPPAGQVQAAAVGASAAIALLDSQIAEQAARRELANAERKPDLTAGASFTFDAEPEFSTGYRASAGITVPLFTRHLASVRVEDAALVRLRAEREAAVADLAVNVAAARARAAAAREQVDRSQADSLPRAAEVERMAQDAYASGQSGLVALLQALQFTRDVRLRALDASVQFQEALADLERAIGAPLP